jgi:hypothetical protein
MDPSKFWRGISIARDECCPHPGHRQILPEFLWIFIVLGR